MSINNANTHKTGEEEEEVEEEEILWDIYLIETKDS
jgi:hypothetical protein